MKIENLDAFLDQAYKANFFNFLRTVDDWDYLLDKRDEDEFDALWVKHHEELTSVNFKELSDESKIKKLREHAFKATFHITNNSEVAGYISDDIGLLAEALSKRKMTTWLEALLSSYLSGRFPH
ncbi:hypothetical protein V2L00_22820 [Pseudomonas alliivorans]|nr:hypothetical protein [Pseudomonas alliivorans]